MTTSNLSKKTLGGFVWKFLERIIAGLVTVVVSIILARILDPEDYSVVGIVVIFFSIANIFISGGLNTALIQKKDADAEDYSSVLVVSLALSAALYLILFLSAPWIAMLFRKPILISLIRVMSLTLIICSVKAVVCAYISNRLEFREFFLATIIGTVISAVVGIWMANHGFGPWSLVAQQMTNATIDTILLLFTTKMRMTLRVSKERLRVLFGFGWKMFASSMINELYENLSPLIIGIRYNAEDLAFYTKGKLYPHYVNSTISETFSAVLFPVMSKLQDDKERLLLYTRSFIRTGAYFLFPLMIGFMAISDNFIYILLTEKWMPASFYMKLFCAAFMFDILTRGNLQAVKALGRSDVHLILNIIKKSAYTIVILCFLFFTNSPEEFAVSVVVNSLIALIVNAIPNRKLLGYSIRQQIMDLLPPLIMSVGMAVPVYLVNLLSISAAWKLAIQVCGGAAIYVVLSLIFRPFGFQYGIRTIREILHKQ